MKKVILTMAMMAVIMLTANAQSHTHTVSNNPAGGAQFSDMQSAINASNLGDTLLVEGTVTPYLPPCFQCGSVNWNKQLVVIGNGFNPNKSNPITTKFFGLNLSNGGNNTVFYGVEFTQTVSSQNSSISGYDFEDCYFDQTFAMSSCTNLVLRNCVFNNPSISSLAYPDNNFIMSNLTFISCIFNGSFDGNNQDYSSTFDHCLFLSSSIVSTAINAFHINGAIFTNCIFMNNTDFSRISNSTFDNNMARLSSILPNGNNIGSNNIDINSPASDPLFVSHNGSGYSASDNYNLQANSPAIGTGTNGCDMGLHGSTSHFSERGEVLIAPLIRRMTINNTSVAPNGNLNVTIHATTPTDH